MATVVETIRTLQAGDYRALEGSRPTVPEHLNWVADVLEPLYVQREGSRSALIWIDDEGHERRFTFAETASMGNRLLNMLRQQRLRKGDSIFAMLPVCPEVQFAYFAATKGGFIVIPAATILTAKDIHYRFSQLLPSAVMADPINAEKIDTAELLLGQKIDVKILVGGNRPGWFASKDIERCGDQAAPETTKPTDPLVIFFTSGTTGPPKLVVHTHLSYSVGHLATAAWIGVRQGDVHYNISQPGWAKFAWSSVFAPWTMGATIFTYNYAGRFDARRHLMAMEKYGVTTFCAPPTVWRMFILENLSKYRLKLREVLSAGEPLNPEVIETWRTATGLTIRDGYGQSESTLMIGNFPGAEVRLGSMGYPSFLYEVTVVDENGWETPPNIEGDIAVRLNSEPIGLFQKYLGPEGAKYAHVFDGGIYRTGDRAFRDGDGRFWFVGRSDDVIKASDYRIGPFEVESGLIEHPAVAEAAVVGSPHPIRGNLVKAFIILRPGYSPSKELAADIFSLTRKNLAPYKAPRIIEFVTDLPKTMSGKIRRIELRTKEIEAKSGGAKSPDEYFYEDLKRA
jgi:acyl-coenzyme A synthetase/AMP-(fatty) acid ligase